MPNYTKPYGDFVNNVDIADATKINSQINQLYNAVNGGLDGVINVPGLGDMTTVTTTSKNAAGAINELQALPVFSMSRQALINGNFDVAQRGTSFTNPASNSYTVDRWKLLINAGGTQPNVVHSRQQLNSGDIQGAYYFYRIAPDGAGITPGAYRLIQSIENATRYLCGNGKKITVSFWAKSSIANKKIGIFANQIYGTGGSPTAQENLVGTNWNLSSTWTKYTFTFATNTLAGKTFGTGNDDYFNIQIATAWDSSFQANVGASTVETWGGAGNIDIAQVQVNVGDQALPFQPRSFAEESALCQRYYKRFGGQQFENIGVGMVTTTTSASIPVPVQRMRLFPTVTYGGALQLMIPGNTVAVTNIATDNTVSSKDVVYVVATVASGLTAGQATILRAQNDATAFIGFDAEL